MTPPFDFRAETALVTGAASGIGAGTARLLAACGARLILSDLDAARGGALAAELGAQFIAADLSQPGGEAVLLAAIPPLTMLVHSASPPRREVSTVGAVDGPVWDAMLTTNLRSGFFLAREVANRMAAAGTRGRIVFVASLHAGTPRNLPHYSAAKAGQVMVVEEMARFYGPAGIRVNAVAPGAIPGGGFAGDFTALAAKVPMRRVGSPEDIARVIAALLDETLMGYVTGALVPVDGGLALYNWIEAASS
jgi:NAD(P)-dependent dehydrogenase (short-subunit alcohol dehydrogenase family)